MGFLSTNANTPNDLSTVVWYDPATGTRSPLTTAQKITYLQAIGDSAQLDKVQAAAAATDAQWTAHPELAKYRDAGYDFQSASTLYSQGLGVLGYNDPAYLAQLQANQQANGGATGGRTDPAGVNPLPAPSVQDGPVRGTTVLPTTPGSGGINTQPTNPATVGGGSTFPGGNVDISQFGNSPFGRTLLQSPLGIPQAPQTGPNQGPVLRQPSATQQGQPTVNWSQGIGNIVQMLMNAFQAMGGQNFTSHPSTVQAPPQQAQGMAPPTMPPPQGAPSQNFSTPPQQVQSQPMTPPNPYTGANNPYTPAPLASLAEVYPSQTGLNQATSTYVGQNAPDIKALTSYYGSNPNATAGNDQGTYAWNLGTSSDPVWTNNNPLSPTASAPQISSDGQGNYFSSWHPGVVLTQDQAKSLLASSKGT